MPGYNPGGQPPPPPAYNPNIPPMQPGYQPMVPQNPPAQQFIQPPDVGPPQMMDDGGKPNQNDLAHGMPVMPGNDDP